MGGYEIENMELKYIEPSWMTRAQAKAIGAGRDMPGAQGQEIAAFPSEEGTLFQTGLLFEQNFFFCSVNPAFSPYPSTPVHQIYI